MAPLTTLKVGGPARFFLEASTEEDIRESLRFASSKGLDVFVLGGGSNILVSDPGFDGLVVRVALKGIAASPDEQVDGLTHVTVKAGEDWDGFVSDCVAGNLAGIECLSGIPGLVGGTPIQNVGAYGQEVSESIVAVRCLDRANDTVVTLSNDDCEFSYRSSIFNSMMINRFLVLSVTFALWPGGTPKIVYKDLKEFFSGHTPTIAEVRAAVLKIRASKSMVIDRTDPNSLSAGSFFKNPIVEHSRLSDIARNAAAETVPYFETDGGKVKIPAAWLVERAGFHKGFSMGNVGISTNHSLALINRGGATAAELIALKDEIVRAVAARFGIELVPEPIFVGF